MERVMRVRGHALAPLTGNGPRRLRRRRLGTLLRCLWLGESAICGIAPTDELPRRTSGPFPEDLGLVVRRVRWLGCSSCELTCYFFPTERRSSSPLLTTSWFYRVS